MFTRRRARHRAALTGACHRRGTHAVRRIVDSGAKPCHERRLSDYRAIPFPSPTARIRSCRRAGRGRAFSAPHGRVRARRRSDAVRRAGRRTRGASRFTTVRSWRRPPTNSASSPAATTAKWSRPMPRVKPRSSPLTRSIAGSIMSRLGRSAPSPGRPARRRSCRPRSMREFEAPSTVGGLAFLPKGFRLALAHYNGATLWFPNAKEATPELLEWKGSHLGATVSPDGRFLVTTMQEPMLHGWRLADRKHMRMSGYASRVTSMSWTADGDWLATSGAPQLILWPFQGKDGPMGKEPRVLAPAEHRVEVVACHPKDRSSPSATATAWCSSPASRTAPRSWSGSRATRRSARSPGARTACCFPSARKTAKPACSISPDFQITYCRSGG